MGSYRLNHSVQDDWDGYNFIVHIVHDIAILTVTKNDVTVTLKMKGTSLFITLYDRRE